MRLGRSASGEKRRKDNKLGRTKHKRLDAICEKAYSRSHIGDGRVESIECNVEGDDPELRRSSRARKAPVLLDTSPPPAKKRRKVDTRSAVSSVDRVKREDKRELEDGSGGWRSRLRTRGRSVRFKVREKENLSPKGKRKLFDEIEEAEEESMSESEEFDEVKDEMVLEKSTVMKSQRPGRIKASNVSADEHQEIDVEEPVEDDDNESSESREVREVNEEGATLLSCCEIEGRDDTEVSSDNAPLPSVDIEENDAPLPLVDIEKIEDEADKQLEESRGIDALETIEKKPMEVDESMAHRDEDGGNNDKPLMNEAFEKLRTEDYVSDSPCRKQRIKEGRHCGLCGTSNDGKPPKKMAHDGAGSDGEAYSGSSASEESTYDAWDGFGDEAGWLGRLLGPVNDRFGIAGIWVHQQCAVWSPEVYFAGLGCLKNVRAALCRGRVLKCSRCGRPGATIGCRVDRCPKTYHLPCARANGCIFDHRKFLIACTDHRHLFQPDGTQCADRLKKMKAKKMKLEVRKTSNDAWRKDAEAEEKWLENCGEDEEFLKRESKRLHRDLLRIAPTYIGGSSSNQDMQFGGWESVAGLQNVIQCMKEVVILPLLYPEFFKNLGLTPPRGVLLHGYPGTGKTLAVRALIGSCARGDKRIAYFARKGADCLGKYVGDAERQLRLLFQVAEKSQPSIIFFDEIDGLAPSRTRQQDQTHSSVVSTLLALMDGLKSRGSVVVIGATNRPDAVDPALRRPGRFDREIYFPLPSLKDREAILSLHTQKWPKPITGSLLKYIAMKTVGFAGADLQALCTQAVIIALRRRCPLQELLSKTAEKTPHGPCPSLPDVIVEERDWLEALSCSPPPCSRREAGTAANNLVSSPLHTYLVPCLLQPLSRLLISLFLDERVWLPLTLSKAATLIENIIVSTLDKKKLKRDNWGSHAQNLLQETNITSQIEGRLRGAGIVIGDSCFGDDTDYGLSNPETSACPGMLQNISYPSRMKSGFRVLISGNPRSGQRHLASCLLHYFVGNVEVQKVDLATISQEGHGDTIQGLTQVLMRCASLRSCMIFMPRIDLWAIEISTEEYDVESDKEDQLCSNAELADTTESQNAATKSSFLWNSFIEQVDSICVNTPLMILATSELEFRELPSRVRQFFKAETLRGNFPTPMADTTVPQFLVEIHQKFDCDAMLDSCAAKLSKYLAEHFVQMQHCRNHIHFNSNEGKVCDTVQGNVAAACPQSDPVSASGPDAKLCPSIPVSVKGKSNLLLAISTFGYQILLYPHFAELCWVTSKLKEGPSANIHGPWKGWPFNSCIVRPINSVEKIAAVPDSGILKVKEKFSIVRGLIAVGLAAYRGEYTSLGEVASEVREVLELLVGRINTKIQAGKDRCCYIRLMSQVAYLEDIVLSWVHALQRLEVDVHSSEADTNLPGKASLDHESSCKDPSIEGDVCKKDISNLVLNDSEVTLGKSPQEVNGLNGDGGVGNGNTFTELSVKISEHDAEARGNDVGIGKDSITIKRPNGFAETKSVNLADDGPGGSGDRCSTRSCSFQHEDGVSLADNNVPSENITGNANGYNVDSYHSSLSPKGTQSNILCSYHCCSECLVNLHHLVKEILNRHWALKGNHSAAEEVHDIVSSLSSKLHAAVRRVSLSENSSSLSKEKPMEAKYAKYCQEKSMSPCSNSKRLPIECHCQSTRETKSSHSRLDANFIFRDGVLITTTLGVDCNLSFHCNFKTLCLCSLIETIVMNKEHLE